MATRHASRISTVPKPSRPDKRHSPFRRQVNEGFCNPDGTWAPFKTIAIFGQIVLLYHLGKDMDRLIEHWDALALIAGFVIVPDAAKQFLRLKWGQAAEPAKAGK